MSTLGQGGEPGAVSGFVTEHAGGAVAMASGDGPAWGEQAEEVRLEEMDVGHGFRVGCVRV
ncbi:hypothetical protein DGo_PB0126 (plasmid) [Deinococcus gobiensis I-0]|uniref:Uncharacterized protein n=1 Tax=Deinococcus gobiensis (strain DSM 21396 / JCM 16679 / CGMCC 1.7299 / I-0) TaxID=745776 RepID=H8H1J8_DEIGI|nr:hypothetical protein DGo_PB0126 [Deinococcus gobiensis I-0]